MSFRRTVAAALLTVTLAVPCAGLCSGWSTAGHERMACCVGKTQDEADTCCAAGDVREGAESFGWFSVSALPAPGRVESPCAFALVVAPYVSADLDSHDPLTTDSERHVRLSVFLI
jgi:hypothetical protein